MSGAFIWGKSIPGWGGGVVGDQEHDQEQPVWPQQ